MFCFFGPRFRSLHAARVLARLLLALAMVRVVARAQTPGAMLSAPAPQLDQAHRPAQTEPVQPSPASAPSSTEIPTGELSAEGRGPAETPVVTISPHHGNDRFWLSGQANIIFQGDLPFHSTYEGANSFRNAAQYKTSLLGTLYTALRPTRSIRYNTDLILDLESSGGRGLSQALGLAGFTNLDVVRNPTLGSTPYLARYGIHQVFGLTQETMSQEPGFFAVA
ncbi:MAG TPA: hypothetical protein VMQ76_12040, partial [Terracidiphilus sp.]|nr:hypothetical protein [Terracidiphilus sp.]